MNSRSQEKIINIARTTAFASLCLLRNSAWAASDALVNYNTLTGLNGDWMLAPADIQAGGATRRGSTANLVGTDSMAISFKVVGKGSAAQENLLSGTTKEMVSMYHCSDFRNCSQARATHYCARQNRPQLILDAENSGQHVIVMSCDMNTSL